MGIPSYFAWLVRRFESDIISSTCPLKNIEQLYLDFNCAIHPAARSCNKGTITDMYNSIIKYLEYIIDYIKPIELVYIAIDGVAPAAKMKQQRSRRYKSILDRQVSNDLKKQYCRHKTQKDNTWSCELCIDSKDIHDFNMISPATDFMNGLTERIKQFILSHKQGKYKHLSIILDDASFAGEGEHKILLYLKNITFDKNVVIYGLDSDLIMLSLSTHRENLCLIREDTMLKNNDINVDIDKYPQLSYFNIKGLRQQLINILNPFTSIKELEGINIFAPNTKKRNDESIIDFNAMKTSGIFSDPNESKNLIIDYLVMSFLLGNDFVPAFPSLKIKDGGIEQILRAYKKTLQSQYERVVHSVSVSSDTIGNVSNTTSNRITYKSKYAYQYLVMPDGRLNIDFFIDFIKILSDDEHNQLLNQKIKHEKFIKYATSKPPTTYEDALKKSEFIGDLYIDVINVAIPKWENRYYNYHMNISKSFVEIETSVETICSDYLNAINWITQYYLHGCKDWYWFYVHDFTPLLKDFYKFINTNKTPTPVYLTKNTNLHSDYSDYNGPVDPIYQLLMIMPPQSANLLPPNYRWFMTDETSPLNYYYPLHCELEYYGKRFRWECHSKLPLIKPATLIDVVNEYKLLDKK
jgi:5'-3' exonuclease